MQSSMDPAGCYAYQLLYTLIRLIDVELASQYVPIELNLNQLIGQETQPCNKEVGGFDGVGIDQHGIA